MDSDNQNAVFRQRASDLLATAQQLCGGQAYLATALGVEAYQISRWIARRDGTPEDVVVKAAGLVDEVNRRSATD
jgi:hypothetical protein